MKDISADLLRSHPLPTHKEGDKNERGCVLIVGGSLGVPGALLLAGEAALRVGAGKLQLATCRTIVPLLGLAMPEALVMAMEETEHGGIAASNADRLAQAAHRTDAVLIGPGMMEQPATGDLVTELLDRMNAQPTVLDAGALHCLGGEANTLARHAGRLVITPHAGEMARLLGVSRDEVENDPLAAGRRTAAKLHCVVVMKGARTNVVSPDGNAWLFSGGTIGLATSGSGDTLAGVISGLLSRGTDPVWAALWGVYLHGVAGSRLFEKYGGIGFLAREIPGELPRVMADLG